MSPQSVLALKYKGKKSVVINHIVIALLISAFLPPSLPHS